ncbi:MAG: HyaD/HybD family hydrogenase maturation endopeptidase [Thermodesulfovibrionales bacterium]
MRKDKDIVVVGIGNTLMSDDGAGVFAVQELIEKYDYPDNVELIDGGTKGLDLLPFVEGKEKLLFIDAINLNSLPGTIGELTKEEIPGYFATKLSVHQIALPDLIGAGNLLGTLPEEIHLIGIQPESIEIGYGMTPHVKKNFNDLLSRVIAKLEEWGVKAGKRKR